MKIVFIGDSHGKFEGFNALARYAIGKYDVDEVVSVGDFGAGWDWSTFKN